MNFRTIKDTLLLYEDDWNNREIMDLLELLVLPLFPRYGTLHG